MELRRLQFEYVGLPRWVPKDKVGGFETGGQVTAVRRANGDLDSASTKELLGAPGER